MNPRSSNAVISRWMPDFERKVERVLQSRRRKAVSLGLLQALVMKRKSSNCFRVSISGRPR